jgi:hypothetical protein
MDGAFSYSKVVTVKFSSQIITNAALYPNPGDGHFVMKIQNTGNSRQLLVQISNASGNLVQQLKPVILTAENLVPVDLSKQPAGMYFIQLIDKDGAEPIMWKVIKY